jgi:hypothetical protein
MKHVINLAALGILLTACQFGFAQTGSGKSSGLYLTSRDFEERKLSYPIDCNNKNDKIRLNDFFGSSSGFVLSNGEKHKFDKKNVYGYHTCDNKNFRFFGNSAYQILDTAGFYIYYQYKSVEQTKGKGLIKADIYFFSKKGDDEITVLNSENLKKAFPENHRLHYAIDANFKSDKDLAAYDSFQKTYKIKYLYDESVK